ncbi:MAG: InlB B-repeat-containing protein, partial [Clostridia bacterium]
MKIFKKLICLILVIGTLATLSLSAFALEFSGSSNLGGSTGDTATKGFSVPYTSSSSMVGYRISVLNSSGVTEVVKDFYYKSTYMSTYKYFLVNSNTGGVQNKYQLKNNWSGSFETTTKTMTYWSSLVDADDIVSWSSSNADAILIKLGYSGGESDLAYGDRLLIEPLFMISIASTKCCMTISDIAMIGSHIFGKTGNVYSAGWSDGTWGYISNYTQKFWPNYLHTTSSDNSSYWSDLWSAAPTLSSIATFGTLLDSGYGVAVGFKNTTATYTVSFNANGGSGAPSSQTKIHGVTLTLSSTKPTRTGYTFLGWSTSSSATSATYSSGGSYTTNASDILYAVWKANTYTVTYNANGGTSGSVTSQTKTYGVSMTISSSATPSRTGYSFLGWSTSSSATSATYSSGGSYTTNASDILYAVWKANTYTVTYNANGGKS